jgi:tRNA-specific 2-thiouridylase
MVRKQQRVVVAMSGGVDSSVAAALLLQQGYEVIGLMLRLWSEPGKEDENRCCTPDSLAQARRVAYQLDIPFYAIDAREIFHDMVVNYFLNGYACGLTPNPCLICNRQIRWGFLRQKAHEFGANYMATGHYAQISTDVHNQFILLRSVDKGKDQSYVLYSLNQEQLAFTVLPVGGYAKSQVRKLAKYFNLPVTDRKDSQDLCFLAGDDYRNFLIRNYPQTIKPGEIVSISGDSLGWHSGLAFYTIGQRKGLNIYTNVPLYVLAKDLARNKLIVGPREALGKRQLTASSINWISGAPPANIFQALVKIRYTAEEVLGLVSVQSKDSLSVEFSEPLRDITPGQAVVFYDHDVCLGGGIIQ